MFDPGDFWVYSWTVKDATGTPADAGAFTCTLFLPDGTSATTPSQVTVAHTNGTGIYTTTYGPLVQPGRYTAYAQATGSNASADMDEFDVRPAASTALLSLADARASLNFVSTLNDEELRVYIDAATDLIEQEVGPILPRTVTETVTGRDTIALTQVPVLSVTSVTGQLVGSWTIDPGDLDVNLSSGILRRFSRAQFYDDVYTVVYVAGRSSVVPERFRQAARAVIKNLWSAQRGSGVRPGSGDEEQVDVTIGMTPDVMFALRHDMKVAGIA